MRQRMRLPGRIVLLVVSVMLMDFAATLSGQWQGYWTDPTFANEEAPHGYYLLSQGAGWFAAAYVGYVGLAVVGMRQLPQLLSLTLAITLYVGHVKAASTWLAISLGRRGIDSGAIYYLDLAYLAVFGLLAAGAVHNCLDAHHAWPAPNREATTEAQI